MVYNIKSIADFEAQLEAAGGRLVVVHFYAAWSGPCKVMSNRLTDLAVSYGEKIVTLDVDVDECEELSLKHNVSSMPTFVFIKNKKTVDFFAEANGDKLKACIAVNV